MEHRRRQTEITRLRRFELHRSTVLDQGREPPEQGSHQGSGRSAEEEGASESKPPATAEPARRGTRPDPGAPLVAPDPRASSTAPGREIGAAIRSPEMQHFLSLDPTERFDIQSLNAVRFLALAREAAKDYVLLLFLARRAETLMVRVKREIDDPLSAGAFIREQVLAWYRQSPEASDWSARMSDRWGGMFAESRVSGGKLLPWLNVRLWGLREEATRTAGLTARLRRGLSRNRSLEDALSRTPAQMLQAEVAQAILDDLAAHARSPEMPLPLVRLSELALRRQVATVNEALAVLLTAPDGGPFVILHPNRYPDCDEVVVRPPAPSASGAALAYSLFCLKPSRRGLGKARGEGEGPAGPEGSMAASELETENVWQLSSASGDLWRSLLEELRRDKRRLDSPPKDFRGRPAYVKLRDLLLADADARVLFLAVKWRGRPSGLPLVVALLAKGSIAPEVTTDHEYIEAELGDLAEGDPAFKPENGQWNFRGWHVTREGDHRDGFRYAAVRAPA